MGLPAVFASPVRTWFDRRFPSPTPVQSGAWEACAAGDHALVIAPTGSGKTLAAFLWFLDRMYRDSAAGDPGQRCRLVYLSPLRALGTDIRRNLEEPLEGIAAAYAATGAMARKPVLAVRTGDTPQRERQAMQRRPPDILVTTPESLAIMLASRGGRGLLGDVEAVIVDEVHYLLDDKRGSLLLANLERLVDLAGDFQRVGVSATVEPPGLAAAWLGGFGDDGTPRPVRVVEPGGKKDRAFRFVPLLGRDGPDAWKPVAERIVADLGDKRSTLVFSNSRRAVERLALLINEAAGDRIAWPHHGSLSREVRQDVEQRLKAGDLRVVVATSSLELGIDIGEVDEVVLVQCPWSLASLSQRIGRAGHGVGEVSRAAFHALHPFDLFQELLAARGVLEGRLALATPPECPLDVLPQVILGEGAVHRVDLELVWRAVHRAWPWRDLGREDWDRVVAMLAGAWTASGIQELAPRIKLDPDGTGAEVRAGAVLELYGSGGTIPDRGLFDLRLEGSNDLVGTLDEEFVWERRRGERFLLGNQTWEISAIEDHRVVVRHSPLAPQFFPFWRADPTGRDPVLGAMVMDAMGSLPVSTEAVEMRASLETMAKGFFAGVGGGSMAKGASEDSTVDRPAGQGAAGVTEVPRTTLEGLASFLAFQVRHTGCPLPSRHHLVVEETRVDRNSSAFALTMVHSLHGLRINTTLALALRGLARADHGMEDGGGEFLPSDNGILVMFPADRVEDQPDPGLGGLPGGPVMDGGATAGLGLVQVGGKAMSRAFRSDMVAQALAALSRAPRRAVALALEEAGGSAALGQLFRHSAGRALLLSRGGFGKRLPLWLSRRKSRRILETVAPHKDFPILREAWKDLLARRVDLDGMEDILIQVAQGSTRVSVCRTERPSVMAEASLFALGNILIYEGDTPTGRASPLAAGLDLAPPPPRLEVAEAWHRRIRRLTPETCPQDTEALWYFVLESVAIPQVEWLELAVLCRSLWPGSDWPVDDLFPPGLAGDGGLVLRTCEGASLPMVVPGRWADRHGIESVGAWLSRRGPVAAGDIEALWGELGEAFLGNLPDTVLDLGPPLGLVDAGNYDAIMAWQRRMGRAEVVPRDPGEAALELAQLQGLVPGPETHSGRSHSLPTGPRGLEDALWQVRGLPLDAAGFEEYVLPVRCPGYNLASLGQALRETGLHWTGAGRGRIRLVGAEAMAGLDRPYTTANGADPTGDIPAQTAKDASMTVPGESATFPWPDHEGAWDFWTLQRRLGMDSGQLAPALWDEVWKGLASNDDPGVFRTGLLSKFGQPAGTAQPGPGSGSVPGTRPSQGMRPPSFRQWQQSRPQGGRWFPLSPGPEPRSALERHEELEALASLLFERWPVLCKPLVDRELVPGLWRTLLPVLQRMELAGAVHGGLFFQDLPMPQFTLAGQDPADTLPSPTAHALWFVHSADPASPCGLIPGMPPRSSRGWIFMRGPNLLGYSARGLGQLTTVHEEAATIPQDSTDLATLIFRCARTILDRDFNSQGSVVVDSIDGEPARNHTLGQALAAAGFRPDGTRLRLWKY